jgi:hypothetical protein
MGRLFGSILLAVLPAVIFAPNAVCGQEAPSDQTYQEDPRWPRVIDDGDTTFTVYQPQVDVFENARLEARAAVQVETKVGEKKRTTYGVIWITANALVDKEKGLVQLDDVQIARANFPTAGDRAERYLAVLRRDAEGTRTVSLARIEANLAITQADKKGNAVALKNDPPKIFYRSTPALLVLIDGDPAMRPVEGVSGVDRVINTRALILGSGGTFYMPIADRWLSSGTPTGPWRLASAAPAPVQGIRDAIAKDESQSRVDLMEETSDDVKGALAEGTAPEIIVSTVPAELIVTQGEPQMKPVTGTELLYVANTTGDILLDLKSQDYYIALTGRWFRSKSLEGPWQFVEGDKLPKDFANIPANDPKASILATVPGTPAAQEAVIANGIPQTAQVDRAEATFESSYDGEPKFQDVPDTPLQYAVNSPAPIVRVDATTYYAVQGGVWFTGPSPFGPWTVATAVPPVIYTIPATCPIHYITYVRIYRSSPTTVWVGYTPGYLGTCDSPWGTVVYGTGWYYPPWIGSFWFGAPWTWGFGVGFWWSPWSGWGWGFGWGGYRPYYSPWWGPYYGWHPRPRYYRPSYPGRPIGRPGYRQPRENWNAMNVYNRPGQARRGVRPAVQPPATRPGPATRPSRPDNVFAGPDGRVYRPQPSKPGRWETHDGATWKPVQPAPGRPSAQPAPRPRGPSVDPGTLNQLSRDQRGRKAGDARVGPRPPQQAPRAAPPRSGPAPKRPR